MTTWVKVYNSLPAHPKTLAANAGMPCSPGWLYVCGLCYSNEHLTDGFIPTHVLPALAPGTTRIRSAMQRLVASGQWHKVDGGWRIHDYSEVQRSADEIRDRRAQDANRKAHVRNLSKRTPHGHSAESAKSPARVQTVDVDVEGREQKAEVEIPSSLRSEVPAGKPPGLAEKLCDEMSEMVRAAHGIDPRSSVGRVTKGWVVAAEAMLTVEGHTPEQIRYAFTWVCRHHYWSKRVRSMPRLRSEFEQVAKEIREQRERGTVVQLTRKPSVSDLLRDLDSDEQVIEATVVEELA